MVVADAQVIAYGCIRLLHHAFVCFCVDIWVAMVSSIANAKYITSL